MEQNIFEKLRKLQDVLFSIYRVDKEIKEIPKSLATKQDLVQRLKMNYIEKNKHVERKQDRLMSLNAKLNSIITNRQGYEERMSDLPADATRESEILDKQIKETSEQEQKVRKDFKKEDAELNELLGTLKNQEELIAQNSIELDDEKAKIDNQIQEKHSELAELEKIKSQIVPGMNEDILFKFDRIIRNKEGKGIVSISDQICSGCHMQLPAQFANNIRTGKDIHFCPYCSRILYYETSDDVQEDFAYSEADAGGLTDLVDLGDFDDI